MQLSVSAFVLWPVSVAIDTMDTVGLLHQVLCNAIPRSWGTIKTIVDCFGKTVVSQDADAVDQPTESKQWRHNLFWYGCSESVCLLQLLHDRGRVRASNLSKNLDTRESVSIA